MKSFYYFLNPQLVRNLIVLGLLLCFNPLFTKGQTKNILMFVSHEDCYYSEYIVSLKALQAAGYTVDVRSCSADSASTYMLPLGTDIAATAATLPGGSYLQFTTLFQQLFGTAWDSSQNTTPNYIAVNGRIQDITDMASYDALVIPGGTGAGAYRVDGSYSSQGTGSRLLPADTIEGAAVKLNALALDALQQGKPVLAQCHGAALPAYWRIPGTIGPGIDSLGYSLLRNNYACGYPEPQTATSLSDLSINHRPDDRVTISSPHSSLVDGWKATAKIITSRDWYPQTVAAATRSLLNILETYPQPQALLQPRSVLILHGGAIDSSNCSAANRLNDIPCNHGTGINLPADYTHIEALLNLDSPNDSFSFVVSQLNLSATTLPYIPSNAASIYTYLNAFDVIIFFKHWSTDVTVALQQALVQYVDDGGGLIALHHGMYNDSINSSYNKNILRDQLFSVESSSNTWSGVSLSTYNLFHTNQGHFITTFGLLPVGTQAPPASWLSTPSSVNLNGVNLQTTSIFDETYNNMVFSGIPSFGYGINQFTPILSNDLSPSSQNHTAGFVKYANPSLDSSVGKLVYMQPGERRESFDISHPYAQMVRNAVAWAGDQSNQTALPLSLLSFTVECFNKQQLVRWTVISSDRHHTYEIETSMDQNNWTTATTFNNQQYSVDPQSYSVNIASTNRYIRLKTIDNNNRIEYSPIAYSNCNLSKKMLQVYPVPGENTVHISGLTQPARILDITGIIKMEVEKDGVYDISNLPQGLYFLITDTGSVKLIKK